MSKRCPRAGSVQHRKSGGYRVSGLFIEGLANPRSGQLRGCGQMKLNRQP